VPFGSQRGYPMNETYVVRVRTDIRMEIPRAFTLWAVMAISKEAALSAVKATIPTGCLVEKVVGNLAPETAKRLELQPDKPPPI
jgi:hypothetical protein